MSRYAQPLSLTRGADEDIPINAGTATDVTGWAIAFCVAPYPVGPSGTQTSGFPLTVAGGGITVVTAATGQLMLIFPKALTSAMTLATYSWSLWRTDTSNSEPLAAGQITMTQLSGPSP